MANFQQALSSLDLYEKLPPRAYGEVLRDRERSQGAPRVARGTVRHRQFNGSFGVLSDWAFKSQEARLHDSGGSEAGAANHAALSTVI